MLWQPSLPDRYTKAKPEDLARDIAARRKELGDKLVILGHHYQTDDIIQHADFIGDSLKLSQTAARITAERDVRWIVFCGVHFMAETADMLTPEHVQVILPDLSAGCSMADMAAYDDTAEAWDKLHESLTFQGWRGRIIPITYVNSTAAIKAFVGAHAGACCTSSNADKVFAWAMAGARATDLPAAHASESGKVLPRGLISAPPNNTAPPEDIKILFLPDQHLGRNTAAKHGIQTDRYTALYDPTLARRGQTMGGMSAKQLLTARVILWAGHCSVHKLFRPEHCDQVRAMLGPAFKILVHPECCKEVVDKSDLSGSTEFIINAIRAAPPGSRWAVGTEHHLVTRLAREAKARGVEVRILSDCQCLCTTMFRIDQPHLLWVLDNLSGALSKDGKPKVVNAIKVHPEVRRDALLALQRMLDLAPSPATATVD